FPSGGVPVPGGAPAPLKAGVTTPGTTRVLPPGAGLAEAAKVVVVVAWLTVTLSVGDRLGAKSAVPLNTAVRVWLPAVRNTVANTAWPPASRLAVSRAMLPSKKVTVPPGVPAVLAAVAVRRTAWAADGALTYVARAVVVDTAGAGGVPTRKYSPMCRLAASVNQRLPFGPAAIPVG